MTMQTPRRQAQPKIELPAPQYPILSRLVTESILENSDEPVVWVLGGAHPFVDRAKIMRMFIDRGRVTSSPQGELDGNNAGVVEIYSAPEQDAVEGLRHTIPLNAVRLVEEVMPIDVFVEELAAAEGVPLDDGTDNDDQAPGLQAMPSNGQHES